MKLNTLIIVVLPVLALTGSSVHAATKTIDGITWTYSVSNGKASVGGGRWDSPAVATSTAGAISIPSTFGNCPVASIGDYAFNGCSGLTSVTIPNSVTNIGNYAFDSCSGLTTITIPNSVTSIGIFAFYGCGGLTTVTIPDSVTNIGDYAFQGCSGFGSVVVPGRFKLSRIFPSAYYSLTNAVVARGVTSIGDYAFYCCSRLTSVTIPNSVTSIGDYAFKDCSGLTSVAIPNSVTSIGDAAFSYCSGLTSVTIPNSVTHIGNYAFSWCSRLTSVTIPNSVTSIGGEAFRSCSGLTSVTIPNSVTNIGNYAFDSCSGLTTITIPNSVTSIKMGAFDGCSGLTSITIPNSVTNIEGYAFYCCSGLTSVTIPNSVTSLGSSAFYGCSGLMSVAIPDSVTSIGRDAFENCNSALFDGTTIPGVKLFDGWAVGYESTLSGEVDLTGVRGIADSAFYGCSGLTSVTIPNSVTSIGDYTFFECSGIRSITVPGRVRPYRLFGSSLITNAIIADGSMEIDSWAFADFRHLVSITIPNSVTNIGEYAFRGCDAIRSVTIPGRFCISSLFGSACASITNAIIADGSIIISENAFSGCRALVSVTIPSSVEKIEPSAFSNCRSLTSVTIPNSVTSIGSNAFYDCRRLTSMAIPDSVTRIEEGAFSGCSITFDTATIPGVRLVDGWVVSCESALFGDLDLTGVRGIVGYGLYGCSRLTSITIPNSIKTIGAWTFAGCSSLTNAVLSEGLRDIGMCAFRQCHRLRSVSIPASVTNIGDWAFSDCLGLEAVHVAVGNENYRSIEGVLFNSDGTKLLYFPTGRTGSYVVPAGVETIDGAAFEDCALISLDITDGVREIGMGAFEWSPNLSTVIVPDSVQLIGDYAFDDCESLSFVSLPGRFRGQIDSFGIREECRILFRDATAAVETDGAPVSMNQVGSAEWFYTSDLSAYDGACLRSGAISSTETTSVETTLVGPGTLAFKWKISAGRGDYCKFYLDGTETNAIATRNGAMTDWATVTLDVPAGEHVVRWSYERGAGAAAGEDAAFLDDVDWRPIVSLTVANAWGTATPEAGTHGLVYGDEVAASVAEPAAADGTRRVCTGWTGTGSVPAGGVGTNVAFRIEEDSTLTWNWRTDHWIGLSVSGGTADLASQWVEAGTEVVAEIVPSTHLYAVALAGDTNGVTLAGTTLTIPADGPREIAVTVEEVTVSLAVESEWGVPLPTNGIHSLSWGTEIEANVVAPEPVDGVRYVCAGWTGTGSVPAAGGGTNVSFRIEADSTLAWNWRTNVWIALATSGPVSADFADGWTNVGETVVARWTPSVPYFTVALSGDTDGVTLDEAAQTISIPADKPRNVALSVTELTLAGALDAPGLVWTTDGVAPWFPQLGTSADGEDAARSGIVPDGDSASGLQTTVTGEGTFSWTWKADVAGNAGVDVLLDGRWLEAYEPGPDWARETLSVESAGTHEIRFEFWNAGSAATREDCAFIDCVSWTPAVPAAVVVDGVEIPSAWLATNAPAALVAAGGDYEAAANATAANGRPVWECYVADLDPESEADLTVAVELVDGKPDVRILSGESPARAYTTQGAKTLGGGWDDLEDGADWDAAGYRFFRVKVELP